MDFPRVVDKVEPVLGGRGGSTLGQKARASYGRDRCHDPTVGPMPAVGELVRGTDGK